MNEDNIIFNQEVLKNMRIGSVLKDKEMPDIKGIEFSTDGKLMIIYNSIQIQIYDVIELKKLKTLKNLQTKISILKFTHNNNAVIFSPQVAPFDLLYWSIYENEIIKIFKGSETYKTKKIKLNPINDLVMLNDSGNNLRIYDISLMNREPIMELSLEGKVKSLIGDFDETGLVLAIGCLYLTEKDEIINKIELHSIENKIHNGSFLNIYLDEEIEIYSIEFQRKMICVLLKNGVMYFIDSYDGKKLRKFNIYDPEKIENISLDCCFTPDSRFLLMGTITGNIKILETDSGTEIGEFSAEHDKKCSIISFSPRFMVFVTFGGDTVLLWVPKKWEDIN